MSEMLVTLALIGAKLLFIFGVVLFMAAYLVLAERKILGRMQLRYGPNRVGPFGLMQPLADVIKLLTKEDFVPARADKWLFLVAPGITAVTALLVFAVVPFGPTLEIFGQQVPLVVVDLNIGVLYFLGVSSMAVYGVVLGGWASNSKYSLLGGVRGLSQMVSYELSLGLSLVPVIMMARSFSLTDIVMAQQSLPFCCLTPWPSGSFSSVSWRKAIAFLLIFRRRKTSWWAAFTPNIQGCALVCFSLVNTSTWWF